MSEQFSRQSLLNKIKGFTLAEIIVVVVIFAIIAAFGLAGYGKTVNRSRERSAILSLSSLHSANEVYTSKYGQYLPGAGVGLSTINDLHPNGLEINIKPIDMTYLYTQASAVTYTATAAWSGSGSFTVRVNQNALSAANPCCSAGACPTLPVC